MLVSYFFAGLRREGLTRPYNGNALGAAVRFHPVFNGNLKSSLSNAMCEYKEQTTCFCFFLLQKLA